MATTFHHVMYWSYIMNGDLSPAEIIKTLLRSGYEVIAEGVKSPVGEVPKGSTVLTDHNDKRAVWIEGKLYQRCETCLRLPVRRTQTGANTHRQKERER